MRSPSLPKGWSWQAGKALQPQPPQHPPGCSPCRVVQVPIPSYTGPQVILERRQCRGDPWPPCWVVSLSRGWGAAQVWPRFASRVQSSHDNVSREAREAQGGGLWAGPWVMPEGICCSHPESPWVGSPLTGIQPSPRRGRGAGNSCLKSVEAQAPGDTFVMFGFQVKRASCLFPETEQASYREASGLEPPCSAHGGGTSWGALWSLCV